MDRVNILENMNHALFVWEDVNWYYLTIIIKNVGTVMVQESILVSMNLVRYAEVQES